MGPEDKLVDGFTDVQKEKEAENEFQSEATKQQSKGFISSLFGTVGGYFYGSKKSEKNEEENTSEEKEHVPREFQMQPDSNVSTLDLNTKQIDLKDESEIIMEESEELSINEKESDLNTIEEAQEELINEVKQFDSNQEDNSNKSNETKKVVEIESIDASITECKVVSKEKLNSD